MTQILKNHLSLRSTVPLVISVAMILSLICSLSITAVQAEQSVAQASAKRDAAAIDVERHTLLAPVDGVVDSRLFEMGERPGVGQPTIVDENTAIISASLVAFSYALVPFHDKRIKTGNKWRVKILNMSMDEEVPNPFLR